MTKLERLIECYPHEIAELENNLRRYPEDRKGYYIRRKLLRHLKLKLMLAKEAKAAGWESWPPRQVSELRRRLKEERDCKYHRC